MAAPAAQQPAAAAAGGDAQKPNETAGFWFAEEQSPTLQMYTKLNRIMFDADSPFQKAQIIETASFGKTLILDSKTQSALRDEMVYHESLVHPALLAHPNPKTVYIGGGGELATAREILKHKSVEKVVMVDIDEVVVEICKEHMPEWHGGCVDDERLELHYDDAKGFMERDERKYDVIIMDIADPIEAGPGIALYTKEFYEFAAKERLNPGGILVTQSGPGAVHNCTECFAAINQTLRLAFDHVVPYTAEVPSFGSSWAFNLAFNKDCALAASVQAAGGNGNVAMMERLTVAQLDALVAEKVDKPLRFLDGVSYKGLFGLPLEIRQSIEAEERVITKDNPVFMY